MLVLMCKKNDTDTPSSYTKNFLLKKYPGESCAFMEDFIGASNTMSQGQPLKRITFIGHSSEATLFEGLSPEQFSQQFIQAITVMQSKDPTVKNTLTTIDLYSCAVGLVKKKTNSEEYVAFALKVAEIIENKLNKRGYKIEVKAFSNFDLTDTQITEQKIKFHIFSKNELFEIRDFDKIFHNDQIFTTMLLPNADLKGNAYKVAMITNEAQNREDSTQEYIAEAQENIKKIEKIMSKCEIDLNNDTLISIMEKIIDAKIKIINSSQDLANAKLDRDILLKKEKYLTNITEKLILHEKTKISLNQQKEYSKKITEEYFNIDKLINSKTDELISKKSANTKETVSLTKEIKDLKEKKERNPLVILDRELIIMGKQVDQEKSTLTILEEQLTSALQHIPQNKAIIQYKDLCNNLIDHKKFVSEKLERMQHNRLIYQTVSDPRKELDNNPTCNFTKMTREKNYDKVSRANLTMGLFGIRGHLPAEKETVYTNPRGPGLPQGKTP